MKKTSTLILCGILLSGVALSADARGWHGHPRGHVGIYFGGPVWRAPAPFYGYDPYYYGPRTIIIEREPPVYIQRQPVYSAAPAAPVAAPSAQVWFYCPDPAGYYPHVQQCAQPWVSVDPGTVQTAPTP